MLKLARIFCEILLYAAFAAVIGFLSTSPAFQYFDPASAQLKLSFRHATERKDECRRLTPEEIAALPPNMRRPMQCGRKRVPMFVELHVDGDLVYRAEIQPTGLAADGATNVNETFPIAPGEHVLEVRMRDTREGDAFNHIFVREIVVSPMQVLVVDFREQLNDFVLLN